MRDPVQKSLASLASAEEMARFMFPQVQHHYLGLQIPMVSNDKLRSHTPLSDQQIEARFAELGYNVTINELFFASEPIAAFLKAREGYKEMGQIVRNDDSVLVLQGVHRGLRDTRRLDVAVIDLGEVRAVRAVACT